MFDNRGNFLETTVATAPAPATSGTTITLTADLGVAAPFNAVVCPAGVNPTAANAEIIRCTARTGASWTTIVRAQEGSSARTIVVGDRIFISPTKKVFDDIETATVNASPTVTVVLNGTTSYTAPAGTVGVQLEGIAGGAGGGGVTGAASDRGGGGGGAGGYWRKMVASPSGSYVCAVGAKGTGTTNSAGSNGGNTTFVNGGTTYTAFGGTGGGLGNPAAGGAGGVVSTNGDVNAGGAPGTSPGNTPRNAGNGGSSVYGGGGLGPVASGTGVSATAYGSGGSGGVDFSTSTNRAGGDGTNGVLIATEFK